MYAFSSEFTSLHMHIIHKSRNIVYNGNVFRSVRQAKPIHVKANRSNAYRRNFVYMHHIEKQTKDVKNNREAMYAGLIT